MGEVLDWLALMSASVKTQELNVQCSNRGNLPSKNLTTIKIRKQTLYFAKLYCAFNNITMTEFATDVIERELKTFKEKLQKVGKSRSQIEIPDN